MHDGKRVAPSASLQTIQAGARKNIADLPEDLRELRHTKVYPVRFSRALEKLLAEAKQRVGLVSKSS
jgi:hypothetical protein